MSYGNVFIMVTLVLSMWLLRVLLMFMEYGLFFFYTIYNNEDELDEWKQIYISKSLENVQKSNFQHFLDSFWILNKYIFWVLNKYSCHLKYYLLLFFKHIEF